VKLVKENIEDILKPKRETAEILIILDYLDSIIKDSEVKEREWWEDETPHEDLLNLLELANKLPNNETFLKIRMWANEWNNRNVSDDRAIDNLRYEIKIAKEKLMNR